jgi:hypothetical protein
MQYCHIIHHIEVTILLLVRGHHNKIGRILPLVISIVIAVIIFDTSIVKVSDLVAWRFVHDWKNISIFIAMSSAYAICYYFVLEFIKGRGEKELGYARGKMRLSAATFRKVVSIIQYVITAILIFIILQVILYSKFSTAATTVVMAISYTTAAVTMGLLAYLFFSWFNENRKSAGGFTVLLYGVSSAALVMNTVTGLALLYTLSRYKPMMIGPRAGSVTIGIGGSLDSILNPIYIGTSILGFILMWSATAILLHSYSKRLGKAKYWFLVSIPLVYFISQFLTLFSSQLTSVIALSPILFTLLFIFSKPVGGILFGAAFYSIGRRSTGNSSPQGSFVRDYMTLAAYGVVLFFVSSQNTVAQPTYPPFGVIAASFVGLSAYMMFLGLYSSAISVSQDVKLRQSIRKSAIQEAKFLESIGTAQMEQELQKRVLTIAKKNSDSMIEETGVQPSLSEHDMKQYLEEVLIEIKASKT